MVTETLFEDGEGLEDDVRDLVNGAGIGLIHRNRKQNRSGVAHGGVALVYNTNNCSAREIDMPNPGDFEVLCSAVNLPGYTRKLVVVACYIPPNYAVPRGRACLSHIEDVAS